MWDDAQVDEWRSFLGKYGVSGKMQTMKIGHLSEGQKSRLVFAMMCMGKPNMLLLDEPTNHLDIEAIDALAAALKVYKGGLVLVSHDFRLIDQVAEEIWVCDKKKVSCVCALLFHRLFPELKESRSRETALSKTDVMILRLPHAP